MRARESKEEAEHGDNAGRFSLSSIFCVIREIHKKTPLFSFMGGIFPVDFCIVDVEASDGFDCEEAFGQGKFQMGLLLFTTLCLWVSYSHTLAFPLISSDVDHWCRQPADLNISVEEWNTMAIPIEADGRHSRCTEFANVSDPNDTAVVECDEWDYDPNGAGSTVVSAWNLVCERSWLKALANAIFIISGIAFLAVSAYTADRFGRAPVVLASGTVMVLASLIGSFATSYVLYVCSRFLIAGCTVTLYVLSGVLLAESSGSAYRAVYLTFSAMAGHIVSETVFLLLSRTRSLNWVSLQLLMTAPTLVLPIGLTLASESPRWLVSRRHFKEAKRVMLAAAKKNGCDTEQATALLKKIQHRLRVQRDFKATPSASRKDRERAVRRKAAIMFASSFSVMLADYILLRALAVQRGTWLQWSALGASACAYSILLGLVVNVDNRTLISGAFVVLGVSCCLVSVALTVSSGNPINSASFVALVLAHSSCRVAATFNFVYVLELFSTPVRGSVACLSFAFGRFGCVSGAVLSALRRFGREDLAFGVAAVLVFMSAWNFHRLPLEERTFTLFVADADQCVTAPQTPELCNLDAYDLMKKTPICHLDKIKTAAE